LKISGNIIDIENRRIFKGEIEIDGKQIKEVREKSVVPDHYLLPGFIF
jgi:adenine deaminase